MEPDRGLRTLLARLTELEDYGFFDIGKTRGSLWTSDRPIVIRIHTTQNDALQRAFASLVFYGLYKDMFRRGIQDRITHALIFDEAHGERGTDPDRSDQADGPVPGAVLLRRKTTAGGGQLEISGLTTTVRPVAEPVAA